MSRRQTDQSGNVIFFVLLGIILLGLVTAAMRSTGLEGANIDRENMLIRTTQVRQHAGTLERGVAFVMQNGASESDLRFAHPDAPSEYGDITTMPEFQVFGKTGGGADYKLPPGGVNDGSKWEFYGHTHLPQAGTDDNTYLKAELVAVLPNVTPEFCALINEMNDYDTGTQPVDDGGGAGDANCIEGGSTRRFNDTNLYAGTPNTMNVGTFTVLPALEGCVQCDGDGSLHFFHVLMVR